jgi:glycyl-tRNA synthetase beta subunit
MPKKKQPAKYSHMITPEKVEKLRNDLPEMMKRKVASIEFRKNLIQAQNRDNYINEYHRLNGYLTSRRIPTMADGQRIANRMQELKRLTKESYSPSVSPYVKTVLGVN